MSLALAPAHMHQDSANAEAMLSRMSRICTDMSTTITTTTTTGRGGVSVRE